MEHAYSNGDSTIQRKIAEIFVQKLALEAPAVDSDLFETGLLDSVTFVDLLLHLENEFQVKCSLEDVDLSNFRSVASMTKYIRSAAGAQGAAA